MFWQRLLALHHLNSLVVLGLDITEEQEVDSFWQLCSRLERLDIGIDRLSSTGTLSSMTFPRIKRIYLSTFEDNNLLYMEVVQRCPSLTTICWDGSLGMELISQFSQLVLGQVSKKYPYCPMVATQWHTASYQTSFKACIELLH
jgi:hypothetical protein